ncbi:MAG: hypothetical protein M1822_003434 [Bathelium mastoideum]|nr:MAG: hypothetical protein M1822_003434 [Bathelium mastoideum]
MNFNSGQEDFVWSYFTINSNDPIVGQWYLIRPDVVNVIKNLPWAILSVVRVSYYPPPPRRDPENNALILDNLEPLDSEPESNPIILVGAPAKSQVSWKSKAEQIFSICKNIGLEHVRVLFEAVRYPFAVSDPLDASRPCILEAVELAEDVPLGSSFGPMKADISPSMSGTIKPQESDKKLISASMGGTIELQENDGELSALLLSVFHPFKDLVGQEGRSNGWRRSSAQNTIHSKMPSIQDINSLRHFCQNRIRSLEDLIKSNYSKFDLTGDDRCRTNIAKLEKGCREQQALIQKLEDCTSGNQGIGFLEYGSGFQNGLDWSLSSFDSRKINNIPPALEELDKGLRKAMVNTEESDSTWYTYFPLDKINLSKPQIDGHVIKQGRTLGVTVGTVNAIPSSIHMLESLELQKEVIFEVHAVLAGSAEQFAHAGDSGAWVLNMKGDWIGSIVGIHTADRRGAISLVMEAQKIVEDIERFTGKKVVCPERSDD